MIPSDQETISSPSADAVSDEELVERFQAGDDSALSILYQRYYQALRGYIKYSTDEDQAEDLTQDVFVIALSKLSCLKEGKCLKAWLYRIATNLIKDKRRHADLIAWLPWVEEKEGAITQVIDLEEFKQKVEQQDFIRQVIRYVSRKYRLCIYLDIFQDLRQHEIADVLNMRERTVRRYIARGKQELRDVYPRLVDKFGALKGKNDQ